MAKTPTVHDAFVDELRDLYNEKLTSIATTGLNERAASSAH